MQRSPGILFCILALTACMAAQTTLNGAGASFPYPIYSKWFSEYHNLHSDVQINYQSVGSGAGIRQVQAGTVEFGASDGPMTDEQISSAKVKVLHVPTVLGAVVPAYNIPGVSAEVKFTPEILAGMFMGKITNWSDPTIVKVNPDIKFPNQTITVVHRSDGSGTSYIFTDYLTKVNSDWANTTGKGTSVKWPVGVGGKGNEGVAGMIRTLPGSIGYVELIYALQNKINYGSVKNHSGAFIKASLDSTTAAAQGVKMPADFRVSITDPPAKNAYPIASFTWLLIPTTPADKKKGQMLKDLVLWCLTSGEPMVSSLSYAPLPKEVADKALDAVKKDIK